MSMSIQRICTCMIIAALALLTLPLIHSHSHSHALLQGVGSFILGYALMTSIRGFRDFYAQVKEKRQMQMQM